MPQPETDPKLPRREPVRVLADFHHHALWESLRLLFEVRFGWSLYRPYGMEWYEEGFWNYERQQWGDAVARQYLHPWDDDEDHGDHFTRWDRKYPGQTFKMVTLPQFRSQRWDYVIATLDHNEPAFHRLAGEVGARYGIEIGNQWGGHAFQLRPFVLSGVMPNPAPVFCPSVVVRQEFDADVMFRASPPPMDPPVAASFVNCFPTAPTYPRWRAVADLVPEIDWKVYGPYCEGAEDRFRAGDIERVPDIADRMREATFGWHDKHWSDGFGHVIHNWLAIGRPPIGTMAYYTGEIDGQRRIVADLLIPDRTCVDTTGKGPEWIADRIRGFLRDPESYRQMGAEAAALYRSKIDHAAEADAVHVMLTGEHL